MKTLDQFIFKNNIEYVKIIKIDVKEGRSVDIILSKNKLDEQDF